MPAEPHITQLLEAYRQKRRAAAGEPLAPHPATRQLLQGEVARTYGTFQPGPTPLRVSWLAAFWPRLALGGSAFALVAVVLFQMQTGHPPRLAETVSDTPVAGERGLARQTTPGDKQDFLGSTPAPAPDGSGGFASQKLKELGDESASRSSTATAPTAAPAMPAPITTAPADFGRAEPLASKPASPVPDTAGGAGRGAGELKLGAFRNAALKNQEKDAEAQAQPIAKKLAPSAPPAPAAPTPLAVNPPVPGAAPVASAPARESKETQPSRQSGTMPALALAKAEPAVRAVAPDSGPALAGTKATADFYSITGGDEAAQSYRYVNPRPDLRQNLNSPATPEVLVRFQVTVNGDQVRFTDADGSIYEGRLLRVEDEKSAAKVATEAPVLEQAKAAKAVAATQAVKEESELKARGSLALAETKRDADKFDRSQAALAANASRGDSAFVVSGTNRRLNQRVEFRGQFLTAPPGELALALNRKDGEQLSDDRDMKNRRWQFEANEAQALTAVTTDRRKQAQADDLTVTTTPQNTLSLAGAKPAGITSQLSRTAPVPAANSTMQFGAQPSAPAAPGLIIRGWAVIGGSNQFEIRAVPTPRQ